MTEDFLQDALDSLEKGDVRHVMLAWVADKQVPATRSANVKTIEQVRWARERVNKLLDDLEGQLS